MKFLSIILHLPAVYCYKLSVSYVFLCCSTKIPKRKCLLLPDKVRIVETVNIVMKKKETDAEYSNIAQFPFHHN